MPQLAAFGWWGERATPHSLEEGVKAWRTKDKVQDQLDPIMVRKSESFFALTRKF